MVMFVIMFISVYLFYVAFVLAALSNGQYEKKKEFWLDILIPFYNVIAGKSIIKDIRNDFNKLVARYRNLEGTGKRGK